MFTLDITTTNEEHRALCHEYWETKNNGSYTHSVASIAKARKIPKEAVTEIVMASCVATNINVRCIRCDQPATMRSRNERPGYFWSTDNWYCDTCRFGNYPRLGKRRSSNRLIDPNLLEKRDQCLALMPHPVDVIKVPLDIAVFLSSLVNAAGSDRLDYLRAVDTLPTRLSPSATFDTRILMRLVLANVLVPHVLSQVSKQDIVAQESIARSVFWQPPIDCESFDAQRLVQAIDDRLYDGPWPKPWRGQVFDLWHQIALEECLEYMRFDFMRRGWIFSPGRRTDRIISTALTRYSIGQVYRIIFASNEHTFMNLREAAGLSQPAITQQAVRMLEDVVQSCINDKLEVPTMERPTSCPETVLTRVVNYRVLKAGFKSLNVVMTKETIHQYTRS